MKRSFHFFIYYFFLCLKSPWILVVQNFTNQVLVFQGFFSSALINLKYWTISNKASKQLRHTHWVCRGWVPETSWSYHFWQPAPRWRPHWWLAKPDNPAMSPNALDKTGTHHTDTQWKAKGGEGRKQKPLNTPHIMLLLPATLVNKRHSPEHEEFHSCASILNPLINWLQMLLVVYLVKLCLISLNKTKNQ